MPQKNRITKLTILLLITAQLPPAEQKKILQYAHAKHISAMHVNSLRIIQKTYRAHWVGS